MKKKRSIFFLLSAAVTILLLQIKTPAAYAGIQNITEGSTSSAYSGNGTDLAEPDGTYYKFNGYDQYLYKDNKIWAREYCVIFPSLSDFSDNTSLTMGWVSPDYRREIWKQSKPIKEWLSGSTRLNSSTFTQTGTGSTLFGCYRSSYGTWENVVSGKNPGNVSGYVCYGNNGYEVHAEATEPQGTPYISRMRIGTTNLVSSSDTAVDGMTINAVDPIVEYKYIVSTSTRVSRNSVISSGTTVKSDAFNINDKITDKSAQYYVHVLAKSYTGLYSRTVIPIEVPRYTLTVNTSSNISSVSGGGTYNAGKTINISATAKENYKFSYWSGTGVSFANSSAASTTITMPAENTTITANGTGKTYNITIDPSGGTLQTKAVFSSTGFIWEGTTTQPISETFSYNSKKYISHTSNENGAAAYGLRGIPVKKGCTFKGWKITSGGGTINTSNMAGNPAYVFDCSYNGDVTITAQWEDNTPPEWITKDTGGKKVSGGLYINPSSWTNKNAIISAEAKDTDSGMSNVKIYSSNKELATGVSSASYTQSTEGIIYYYAVATDKAGNKATTSTKAAYIDKTPPAITSGVSSSGWTNKDIRLTATATDALSGVQKVEIFTASGKSVASGKTGAAYTITEPTNEEYIIRATDAAGNTAEKKQSVQLDKENSDVIIDNGTDTPAEFKPGVATESHVIGWVNKDVPIKVTATDVLSGIKTIELKDHYGTVIKSDPSEMQYTFTSEGISHYTITVTDNAGNTKTINLTVKIDKTPPVITGEEEIKDPNYGLIEHQATDSISGIKSFKLYYYDTMEEVTEEDGLVYKEGNIISFKSMNTYNLYWKLIAEDNAGNITEMTVHTPFNFKIKAEADNLRTETENFLIGANAQLKITLWGYVDTVEVKFERTLEDAAEKEEYTLNRLIESGDAFVRIPEKNDYVEYTFKLPEGVDPREYRIWVNGYRDGWKRTEHLDINLITYDQLCKEQVHKFKRVIKSPTWRKVDEYPID